MKADRIRIDIMPDVKHPDRLYDALAYALEHYCEELGLFVNRSFDRTSTQIVLQISGVERKTTIVLPDSQAMDALTKLAAANGMPVSKLLEAIASGQVSD